MLGHLPLLLHPQAEDVLVIGLGSGMTLGAVEHYPVQRVDVVELEPAVVEAAIGFFQPYTNDALNDPRANLITPMDVITLHYRTNNTILSSPSPQICGSPASQICLPGSVLIWPAAACGREA